MTNEREKAKLVAEATAAAATTTTAADVTRESND
jgi:hypothetical protein